MSIGCMTLCLAGVRESLYILSLPNATLHIKIYAGNVCTNIEQLS